MTYILQTIDTEMVPFYSNFKTSETKNKSLSNHSYMVFKARSSQFFVWLYQLIIWWYLNQMVTSHPCQALTWKEEVGKAGFLRICILVTFYFGTVGEGVEMRGL